MWSVIKYSVCVCVYAHLYISLCYVGVLLINKCIIYKLMYLSKKFSTDVVVISEFKIPLNVKGLINNSKYHSMHFSCEYHITSFTTVQAITKEP